MTSHQPRAGEPLRRGWYYVSESPDAVSAGSSAIHTRAGQTLVKSPHGYPARVIVSDVSGADLARAALLRVADAAGAALEARQQPERLVRVSLAAAGTPTHHGLDGDGHETITLDGPALAEQGRHPLRNQLAALLATDLSARASAPGKLPAQPVARVLFFESLMNSEMEHNDRELSQGVLHMVSALDDLPTEAVLACVKMSIARQFRNDQPSGPPIQGLDALEEALAGGPIGLVCITLLEAYFESVVTLIARLRALGCRAHIAVGGVMPTLTPEHVAVHLPDVSFVCRGAGEYFLPHLATILGDSRVDTPFTAAQCQALASMDGLLAIDPAGKRLIRGNDAQAIQVDSLDRVSLDLGRIQARHLQHGIEISTSRGCIHRCSFCTIIGQMTYQARSADGIVDLLAAYHARFAELFGTNIPPRVYRVHISDDDFVCDRQRALAFFRRLPETPFRLASCQVSVADLCRRDGMRLLPEVDEELLDAITPGCFFDDGRDITEHEYIHDVGPRRWSANLQLGIESFSDAELTRFAKGYKLAHVAAVLEGMAVRGLHADAYVILSNAETTAEELVDGLEQLCSLKLRFPAHFHVRYPVTPRLVSIMPSASYRKHVRSATTEALSVARHASIPGFAEYDYPFVEHDTPQDPLVGAAADTDFFTHDARYTASLKALAALWRSELPNLDGEAGTRCRTLIRRLDGAPRALAFAALERARAGDDEQAQRRAVASVAAVMGSRSNWVPSYKAWTRRPPLRIVAADPTAITLGRELLASSRLPDKRLLSAGRRCDAPGL
ncbi:MAG: radical SAM superfamily enzyme YgiQ (UPF0313 family), partial [Myxococcota bacterium]